MPPRNPNENNDQSKVWISREEYERLRQMENRPPDTPPVISTPAASYQPHSLSDKMAKQQKIVALILAVLLIIVLSVGKLQALVVFIALVFVVFGIMSIVDYQRQRKREDNHDVPLPPGKEPHIFRRLAVIAGILLLIPIIGYMVMIFIVMSLFMANPNAGS